MIFLHIYININSPALLHKSLRPAWCRSDTLNSNQLLLLSLQLIISTYRNLMSLVSAQSADDKLNQRA